MRHVTNRSWTEADIERLKQLASSGATINRAAAALNRQTTAIAKVARLHGLKLVGTREAKAAIRELESRRDRSR